jgi:hypothetical protein
MNLKFLSVFSVLVILLSMALVSCTTDTSGDESVFLTTTYERDMKQVDVSVAGVTSYSNVDGNKYKMEFTADEVVYTVTPVSATFLTTGLYDDANAVVTTWTINTEVKESTMAVDYFTELDTDEATLGYDFNEDGDEDDDVLYKLDAGWKDYTPYVTKMTTKTVAGTTSEDYAAYEHNSANFKFVNYENLVDDGDLELEDTEFDFTPNKQWAIEHAGKVLYLVAE